MNKSKKRKAVRKTFYTLGYVRSENNTEKCVLEVEAFEELFKKAEGIYRTNKNNQ